MYDPEDDELFDSVCESPGCVGLEAVSFSPNTKLLKCVTVNEIVPSAFFLTGTTSYVPLSL